MIIEAFLIGTIFANGVGIIVVRAAQRNNANVEQRTLLDETRTHNTNIRVRNTSSSSSRTRVTINGKRVIDVKDSVNL